MTKVFPSRFPRRSILALAAALVLAIGASAWWVLSAAVSDEVERIAATLALEPGQTVADIGAGRGQYAEALARAVGPGGRVFATELSQARLADIRRRVEAAGLENVTVLEGTPASTNLPDACCDALVLRDVYHHFSSPAAMNRSMLDALRPGGRLLVIDFPPRRWLPPGGAAGGRDGHGVAMALVIEEVTAAGFELVSAIEKWSVYQYAVLFRRPLE